MLETERLLKDKETAAGKPKDDATMLLNHKEAFNCIIDNPDYVVPLTIARIEDIHSILVKDLPVEHNIRQRRVGISGTNYRPLDNEHQIREALEDMLHLQYISPKCHNGIVFKKPLSISSLTTNAFSAFLICSRPLFFPPTSKSIPSILKSAKEEEETSCPTLN